MARSDTYPGQLKPNRAGLSRDTSDQNMVPKPPKAPDVLPFEPVYPPVAVAPPKPTELEAEVLFTPPVAVVAEPDPETAPPKPMFVKPPAIPVEFRPIVVVLDADDTPPNVPAPESPPKEAPLSEPDQEPVPRTVSAEATLTVRNAAEAAIIIFFMF